MQHGIDDIPIRDYIRALRVYAASVDRKARDALRKHRDDVKKDEAMGIMDTPRPVAPVVARKRPRGHPYRSSDSLSDPPPELQRWDPNDDDKLDESIWKTSEYVWNRRWSLPEAGHNVQEKGYFASRKDVNFRSEEWSRFGSKGSLRFSSVKPERELSARIASQSSPDAASSAIATPPPEPAGVGPEHVQLLYHMLRHAESIYGFAINVPSAPHVALTKVTDRAIICRRTGLSSDDIKVAGFSTTTFMPAHYVAVDRQIKAVVVCVRGTANLVDSLTDVAVTHDPLRMRRDISPNDDDGVVEGYGHSGVLRSARNVFRRIRGHVLDALLANPGFELMVTGHSLGAATAAVLALIMRDDPDFPRALAFSFAPLPCMTYELAELTSSFTITVVNGPDIVPRLSVEVLLPYFATARYVADLSKSRKALLALGFKSAAINWDDLESFSSRRVQELSKEHEGCRLYIPGKVFQLVRKNEISRKDAVSNKLFRRQDVEVVAVHRTHFLHVRGRERGMFVSHAPFTYKSSLLLALKGMGAQPLRKMTGGSVFRNLLAVPTARVLRDGDKMGREDSLDNLLERIAGREESPLLF